MKWLNEPAQWELRDGRLTFRTSGQVDFWRHTLVETVRDSGHLYYETVDGDFVARVRFGGEYRDQYDQNGLVVRQDSENYLKAGVEFVLGSWEERYFYNGPARLVNAALTAHGWSEWSVLPQSDEVHEAIWMEVRREGSTFFVAHSLDGTSFTPIKLFALPDAGPVMVGPYATSPSGNGFDVWFDSLDIKQ